MTYWIPLFFVGWLGAGEFDRRTTTGNPFDQPHLVAKEAPLKLMGRVSSGCISGAKAMDLNSPDYIALNPHRNAYWGHPKLVEKVSEWGQYTDRVLKRKMKVLDMGLPYGGPATPRHGSHQMGIDVDIVLHMEPRWTSRWDARKWSAPEMGVLEVIRDTPESADEKVKYVLDHRVTAFWNHRAYRLVKKVAQDPDVNRIIINPSIRAQLCKTARVQERANRLSRGDARWHPPESVPQDLKWLRKLRFFYGHTYHFHVRAHACIGQPGCERKWAPAYAESDWGLGCNKESGPNSYWLNQSVFYLDPNSEYFEPQTHLQDQAIKMECELRPEIPFCQGRSKAVASVQGARFIESGAPCAMTHGPLHESERSGRSAPLLLGKSDGAVVSTANSRACYDIHVHTASGGFDVTKCVPQACGDLISNIK